MTLNHNVKGRSYWGIAPKVALETGLYSVVVITLDLVYGFELGLGCWVKYLGLLLMFAGLVLWLKCLRQIR